MTDPEPAAGSVAVRFERVVKRFGDFTAVAGVDLDVYEGEFFSMLGPSGSGKTTCLRMIAGFEQPTEGKILLGGRDVSTLAPYERDVNTVFQDYALFPHMTVRENVDYGLRVQKVAKDERRRRPRRPSRWCGSRRSAPASRERSRADSGSGWRSRAP